MRKPKAVPAVATAKPETPQRVPYVCKTVDRIATAVADLLAYGGEPADLERVILAAVSHEYRTYSFAHRNQAKLTEHVRNEQILHLPRMLKELADVRIERTDFNEDEATGTAAIIRRSSRRLCAGEFTDFLRDADPEEVRFLYAVLNWWGSKGAKKHELSIASAFFDEIDNNLEVFRVPSEHSAAVNAYVAALLKTKPAEDAT